MNMEQEKEWGREKIAHRMGRKGKGQGEERNDRIIECKKIGKADREKMEGEVEEDMETQGSRDKKMGEEPCRRHKDWGWLATGGGGGGGPAGPPPGNTGINPF